MARGRPPRSEGPPGLGGRPSEDMLFERAENANGENPTPRSENPPFDRTNRQRNEIPWSGRGEQEVSELEKELVVRLDHIRVKMGEDGERLETLWSEFLDQNAVVEQTNSQLRAVEQTVAQGMTLLEQCKNAIITLEQRLNALAQQQLQTNTRLAAAQLAAQSTKGHERPEKVIEQAEQWHRFLMGDLVAKVAPPPPEEVKVIDGLDPESPTEH